MLCIRRTKLPAILSHMPRSVHSAAVFSLYTCRRYPKTQVRRSTQPICLHFVSSERHIMYRPHHSAQRSNKRSARRTLATRIEVAEGVAKAEADEAQARTRTAEIFMVAIQKLYSTAGTAGGRGRDMADDVCVLLAVSGLCQKKKPAAAPRSAVCCGQSKKARSEAKSNGPPPGYGI